jgi:hypothetical protein
MSSLNTLVFLVAIPFMEMSWSIRCRHFRNCTHGRAVLANQLAIVNGHEWNIGLRGRPKRTEASPKDLFRMLDLPRQARQV